MYICILKPIGKITEEKNLLTNEKKNLHKTCSKKNRTKQPNENFFFFKKLYGTKNPDGKKELF